MTSTSETNKTNGHYDPQQCISISYLQFVAVIRSGKETEIIRLCHLLRDPGPFTERYVYEHIKTRILDDRIRQVLKLVHCDNLRTLMELIRKPGLINVLRWNGKKLSKDRYTELLALDQFINWMRNNLIDITTADRDDFWDFISTGTFKIDEHIAYSKEAAIKSRRNNLESQMQRQQTLERKGKKYTKRNIDMPRGYFITPLIDYITEVFCTVDEVLEKGDVQIYEGYQDRNDIILSSSPPQVRPNEEPSDYMKRMLTSQTTTSLPSNSINNDGGLSIKEENNDGDSDKVFGECSARIIIQHI